MSKNLERLEKLCADYENLIKSGGLLTIQKSYKKEEILKLNLDQILYHPLDLKL